MNNFIFENKTKVYFGKGGVKEYLGCLLKKYGPTVMLAYGGGSIKKNGVYDEVMGILNAQGKKVIEFSGIMPNPTYKKVQEGAKLAREHHVDLILAVGGGSVSDCCKIISAQAKLDKAREAKKRAEDRQKIAEDALEQVRLQLEEQAKAEKKAALGADKDVAQFEVLFNQGQELANKMRGLLLKARGREDLSAAQMMEKSLVALGDAVKNTVR